MARKLITYSNIEYAYALARTIITVAFIFFIAWNHDIRTGMATSGSVTASFLLFAFAMGIPVGGSLEKA